MKNIIGLLLLLTVSCSHTHLAHEARVDDQCSAKINKIKPTTTQQFVDLTKQATAGTMSLALAGLSGTADAVVITLTHPVTKVTFCLAAVGLSARYNNYHNPHGFEICQGALNPYTNPKLAQLTLDGTKAWRCPNLDYIGKGLRQVASCYANNQENDKARQQLENVLKNKDILDCLSTQEVSRIKDHITRL